MANKEVGDWNPMAEAHRNPTFNSYVEGPGSHLNTHQQPFNWGGGGGRGRNAGSAGHHSNDSEVRLYIANIPLDMTQEGLKNVLMEYAMPKKVYISDKRKSGYQTTWGTADFATFGDAEATMRGCNEKPPYNFMVKFATKTNLKNNGRDYEKRLPGPATPSAPIAKNLPLQEVQPKSPEHSEKLTTGANPSANQPTNSVQENSFTNATDEGEAHKTKCKVCLTETSGVCGACKNAPYCSQACATADFPRHVTECYVPVPAVLFSEAGNRAVYPPGNEKRFPSTPPKHMGPSKNHHHATSGDSSSYNGGKDMGAAGDSPYNCPHSGVKMDRNNTLMEVNGNKDNMPLANGDQKPVFKEPTAGDNRSIGRKSYQGGKSTNDWQDRAGNMSSSTPNRQSGGHQSNTISKQANEHNMPKKQRVTMEGLEVGTSEEVEVVYSSMHGLFVNKTCNKTALEMMNNALISNWSSMLPFDNQEEMCAAPFEEGVYRCKILQNKSLGSTKLRVKYVDFGNIELINSSAVKALPETFFELPAQALQLKFPDGSTDMYSSYEFGSILNVTAIKKIDGSWLVDISQKEAGDAKSLTVAQSVSPPRQSDAVAVPASPPVTNVSPAVPSTRTSVVREKQNNGVGELSTLTSSASDLPPLGVPTMVTITKVLSDKIFWGTLNSRNEEIATMESELNLHLESNPSPCQPTVNDVVAVFYEDCWYRAKVINFTSLTKVGLLDYGKVVEVRPDLINSLPDEVIRVPRHAVKYKLSEGRPGFLLVDKQICVQRTSTELSDGCIWVEVKIHAEPCIQPEYKPAAIKVADVPTSHMPHAAGITSLAAEQLPTRDYTQVTITEVAGKSFWVYLTANTPIALEMLMKLNKHCTANPTPCQPQVGDIVAAFFDNDWYRAKVLTVLPKVRVAYIDYGNESEVTADQVKVLPKEFALIPTQAIKITFSKSTSDKYYDSKVDSIVSVKPVARAGKSADGAVIVEVEGDTPKQVEAEAPTQVSTASQGLWFPLQSVEMPSGIFVKLNIALAGKTGYACLKENVDALNLMMCRLHEIMQREKKAVSKPQVGEIVAVPFDNIWHRGKVLAVVPQLQVGLVDYGNTCIMTPDQLYCLPECLHELPGQAFKIRFMDGTPEAYFNLDETAIFEGKIQHKLPDGTVIIEGRNLLISNDDQPEGQSMEQTPAPAATVPVKASAINTESSVTAPEDLLCSKIEKLSYTSDNQVVVTYTAEGQVWVNLSSKSEDLRQTMINLGLMESKLQPCNPKVGDYVAVYLEDMFLWHRGKVRSMSSGTVSVIVIDYGCVLDVTPNLVKALPAEITKLPAQGIPIQLCAESAANCLDLKEDDIVSIKLLGMMLDGTAVVLGLDNKSSQLFGAP